MKERMLYFPLISFFAEQGYSYDKEVRLFNTVGNHNKRADLLFKRGKKTICIEAKLKDWGRALIQAYLNSFFIHESYVALWHKSIRNVDLDKFKKYGVGLISVDKSSISIIIAP